MEREAIFRELERIAPPQFAEEIDQGRIGLVIEGRNDITKICSALDASPAVITEAVRMDADMLIVHHTPIWTPVTMVTGPLATLLKSVLAAGMNIFVMHTNLDHAHGGVNDTLAELLGLASIQNMTLGVCGRCALRKDELSRLLGVPLRVWGEVKLPCNLAVVGGSGFIPELIAEAVTLGADAYLSSELKHAVARSSPIPLIEATHYSLEAPAMKRLAGENGWHFIDDPPDLQLWM